MGAAARLYILPFQIFVENEIQWSAVRSDNIRTSIRSFVASTDGFPRKLLNKNLKYDYEELLFN